MINENTPWRHAGTVPYEIWRKRINDAGGLSRVAARSAWEAAGDDSALMLEMLREESSYASDFDAIPSEWNNPWNLQTLGKGLKFATVEDGIRAWRDRLYSPTYKDGVYAKTDTIREMISRYAPESDGNDTEGYIEGVVNGMNTNGFTDQGGSMPLVIRQKMIPAGNRNRPGSKLNNADLYIWIHDTGNPNMGAGADMHADYAINGGGSDSVSYHNTVDDHEWIQLLPFDEVGWHAGDSCDDRVNDIGCFQSVAVETCVNVDADWAQTKQNLIDGCVAIIRGDDRFNYAGRKGKFSPSRIRQHNASSGKNCPAKIRAEGSWGFITGKITSNAAGTPTDPTVPPPADEIFAGLDVAVAKRLFGSPIGEDGKKYSFDPNGPVSKLWLARGETSGEWPALTEVWVYSDGRKYFHFEDGYTILDPAGSPPPRELKK